MSSKGKVKSRLGVPSGAKLPDGTLVEVAPVSSEASDPFFLRELLKLAKDRDWPEDFALKHAHRDRSQPKQS